MQSLAFPWRLWCATALIAFTFFGFTLTSAVPVWLDESVIVEYGRVTLAGDADLLEQRPPDLLHLSSLSALDFLAGVP